MTSRINKAFVLGAGLGTRLRPLTEDLPKPLVPVRNRPLITFAIDHIHADLGVGDFMINTHHCPEKYTEAFPEGEWNGSRLSFRHEPVLLDTAGGIDNIRDWLPGNESFLVYNGDILTDLPLAPALEFHEESGNLATMILRSTGDELRVGFDPDSRKVVDLRGQILPDWEHRCQFTGIYLLSPQFLAFLQPGKIESVVLTLLEVIRESNAVGGVVIDEGNWSDLGERESYLRAVNQTEPPFPRYGNGSEIGRIDPSAEVSESATVDGQSTIGPGCRIGPGSRIERSVLWENVSVGENVVLTDCVIRAGESVTESLSGVDR